MTKYDKHCWPGIRFVAIPSDWFYCKDSEFQKLSVPARMVYFCIKSGYIPQKRGLQGTNGKIVFPYSTLKKCSGFSSDTTISKAIRELEINGWIHRKEKGGFPEYANKYELTGKYDPCV
jgi:hypothetical protein